jgi:Protein of unknown function (DUF4013)
MSIVEIVKESINYTLSDPKKLLMVGILLVLTDFFEVASSLGVNGIPLGIFGIITIIFTLLFVGYEYRIIESTIAGFIDLPEINNWPEMFINGIKILIVGIIYYIPLFATLLLVLLAFIGGGDYPLYSSYAPVLLLIIVLLGIIINPILLVSLVNMVYHEKFSAAFKFREIFMRLSHIGLINLVIWYFLSFLLIAALSIIQTIITVFFNFIGLEIVGILLISLTVNTFFSIYIFRSLTLIYLNGIPGYLICGTCGGYYELQHGESPEDFEDCQCGGKLEYKKIA